MLLCSYISYVAAHIICPYFEVWSQQVYRISQLQATAHLHHLPSVPLALFALALAKDTFLDPFCRFNYMFER